jgi:predicted CoA-binding protein
MQQSVEDFVKGKKVAIVGMSRGGKKFGNIAFTELRNRGYEVFAVHPEAKEIGGEPCYASLKSLAGRVDGVLLTVQPRKAGAVLEEAAQAGIKNVWLQSGGETPELIKQAQELGLNMVTGKCILMYATPVTGMHNVHRFFVKVFGKL